MSALRDMRAALGLLSVIPVRHAEGDAPTPRAAAWFPVVGLVLGGLVYAVVRVLLLANAVWGHGRILERAGVLVAVAVVALQAALTRLLHWDGLADLADAWWGGHTSERRLEIMGDSSVGAFGVATVVLVMLAQVGAIAAIVSMPVSLLVLVAAPVFGRMGATFGAWLGRPARPGGLGAAVVGAPGLGGLAVAGSALGVAGALMLHGYGTMGLVWSAIAFMVAAAVPHVCASRVGGVTGDVLGASVVLVEMLTLVLIAIMVVW